MYLHLGQDYIVPLQSVVAVFDMDTATASKRTRLLLERLRFRYGHRDSYFFRCGRGGSLRASG